MEKQPQPNPNRNSRTARVKRRDADRTQPRPCDSIRFPFVSNSCIEVEKRAFPICEVDSLKQDEMVAARPQRRLCFLEYHTENARQCSSIRAAGNPLKTSLGEARTIRRSRYRRGSCTTRQRSVQKDEAIPEHRAERTETKMEGLQRFFDCNIRWLVYYYVVTLPDLADDRKNRESPQNALTLRRFSVILRASRHEREET